MFNEVYYMLGTLQVFCYIALFYPHKACQTDTIILTSQVRKLRLREAS